MDSSPVGVILEKTRLPQPLLQRSAVSALFRKLQALPPDRGFESREGRDALSFCLNSSSAAVVDQSARELCALVISGGFKVDRALVELQSALEGCGRRYVDIFVKSIGFLCRRTFVGDISFWRRQLLDVECHPFVRAISCRPEGGEELRRQVMLFILQNKSAGMELILELIKPFVIYSILSIQSSISYSTFSKDLVSDLASLCCSLSTEAVTIIRLLTECLHYFPRQNEENFRCLTSSAECIATAFEVILKKMIKAEMPETEVLIFRVELLEALSSICTEVHKSYRWMYMVELLMRLLVAQKDYGLPYLPQFSSVAVSMSALLCRAEFEHEQLTILKLLLFLRKWMIEDIGKNNQESTSYTPLDLLQIFPAINVLSSTSESIKDAVVSFLSTFEAYTSKLPDAFHKSQVELFVSPTKCKIASVISRLLELLWTTEEKDISCVSSFIEFALEDSSVQTPSSSAHWLQKLKDHYSVTAQQSKLNPSFHHQENAFSEIHSLVGTVTSAVIFHPRLMSLAVDSLFSLALMDPKFNVTFLLGNLFHIKRFCSSTNNSENDLIKLLEMFPRLASSSGMVPLILQILMPMLREDANSILYAMAVRLLCKTWMHTDRVFETLQTVLEQRAFSVFSYQKDVCISVAASIRDVCRHNPDRGVDLILSLSSCIESRDSSVQALGFEAISSLCEADVIDFYTAWHVVEKHMLDYSQDHIVALGLCNLLRWGALDADASPEASARVVQFLWQVGMPTTSHHSRQWVKARVCALQSLKCFEVERIINSVPDFTKKTLEFVVSEDNPEIQRAIEDIIARIFNFEHINRRRAVKEKKTVTHKVEKLLDVFPNVIFSGGKQSRNVGELPGAALLSVNFFSKEHKDASKIHGTNKALMLEVAESLDIRRNIFVALLALQSWKSFFSHWLAVEDTSASIILKILLQIAKESIPRVAENIALAIGALCTVLPQSGYSVLLDASGSLLKWLFQYEHEQRQWAAAVSLGLVSNSLHITDKTQKFDIINGLLEVLQSSRSYHVKGACGIGLGFTCLNLLTQINDQSERTESEAKLLGKIILSLSSTISLLYPSSSTPLLALCKSFLPDQGKEKVETLKNFPSHGSDGVDDFWGAAGLVIGLGNTVSAFYRLGYLNSIKIIKDTLISWMVSEDKGHGLSLSIGSCFVLPSVIIFCERAEMPDINLPDLLQSFSSLIYRLEEQDEYATADQNLFLSCSIAIGSLLSFVLNEGVHSLKLDDIKSILENMRNLYTRRYPPIIQLGGMLGVVNAFGAGAMNMTETYTSTLGYGDMSKDALHLRGPIYGTTVLEPLCTSLIQELFVIAKESEDKLIRRNSAWSISFLRHWWLSRYTQTVQTSGGVSENTLVWSFCSWLNSIEMNDLPKEEAIASVLRCLSKAPRLPSSIDFGPIVKRFMRYGSNKIREESLNFSLAHANTYTSLMLFLDELVLGPRFGTLQLNLKGLLLCHLKEFMKLFSSSRLEGFLKDLFAFFSSSTTYMLHSLEERSLLRVSFWKGLHSFMSNDLKKSTLSLQEEKIIEILFGLLPISHPNDGSVELSVSPQELVEAVNCLSVGPQNFLANLLKVRPLMSQFKKFKHVYNDSDHPFCFELTDGNRQEVEIKKVVVTSRLVVKGCLPVSDLGKMTTFILNLKTEGAWNVLLEVVTALYGADMSVKRQWLLDAVEISCVSQHPATALQFVGILSGRCCDFMPLLILNPEAVLTDLPLTLPSLLMANDWNPISEKLVDMLWESTKRICNWACPLENGNKPYGSAQIDQSQSFWSSLLCFTTRETCLSLKHYLSFEKRLALATLKLP